jgi:hypothetical protein
VSILQKINHPVKIRPKKPTNPIHLLKTSNHPTTISGLKQFS